MSKIPIHRGELINIKLKPAHRQSQNRNKAKSKHSAGPPVADPTRLSCPACRKVLRFPLLLCSFVPQCLCGYESITQNKPNPQNPKTTTTSYATESYDNIPPRRSQKNKPKQTRRRARGGPIPRPLLRSERIQNLGAKRISRFIGGASKIEHPVSRILERSGNPDMSGKHVTHLAAHSCLHYAKQTQFPQAQNHPNLLCHKELHQFHAPLHPKKQTQFKLVDAPVAGQTNSQTRPCCKSAEAERANQRFIGIPRSRRYSLICRIL